MKKKILIHIALLITLILNNYSSKSECHTDDLKALKALYESTNGGNWDYNLGWEKLSNYTNEELTTNETIEDCDLIGWYGIETNTNGRVTCLDLDGDSDCYSFGYWLVARGNNLSGSIPTELGKLSYLETLILDGNKLSGSIPKEIGNLNKLEWLALNYNQLSGSIPPQLGNLNNLQTLELLNNELNGTIPAELGNLNNLQQLELFNNELSGNIPPELGNLSNLWSLQLQRNQLEGDIPTELGNLSNLEVLDLSENQLSGNIPAELGNFNWLSELILSCNNLSDSIPPELGNINNLWDDETAIYLDNNQLIGNIPPELGNLKGLEYLWLHSNQLSGSIPPELGDLYNLVSLSLGNNLLSGSIPYELGNLIELEVLYLASNQLSGCYPNSMINFCNNGSYYGYAYDYCYNEYIYGSNQFDVSWEDFCATGVGACNRAESYCNREDWEILKMFYENTGGDNWDENEGWEDAINTTAPTDTCNLRTLYGVVLDQDGRVSKLNLGSNGLSGNIPTEIGDLTNLIWLDFRSNDLSGKIPPQLGNLKGLEYLWLHNNQLTGRIPRELGDLTKLDFLSLGRNKLTGSIPSELGKLSLLTVLLLSENQLKGSIPSTLGNLSNLKHLYLGDNQLSGNIPRELGQLSELGILYLSGNQLGGYIPGELGNLSKLLLLELDDNQLRGKIPPELGELKNLDELYLSSNLLFDSIPSELGELSNLDVMDISGNYLSGSIPANLGKLENLGWLNLYNNKLNGSIPPELSNLTNLITLDLSYNQLSGKIPSELGNYPKINKFILTNNQLSGNIPKELGQFKDIDMFQLSFNQLSGNIPSELGNIIFSEYGYNNFDLSGNKLTGSIPKELGKLSNLKYFNVSYNQLTGSIPPQLTDIRFSTDAFPYSQNRFNLSNNRLTGNIPLGLGNTSNLKQLDLSSNKLDGSIPANLNNLEQLNLSDNHLTGNIPLELGSSTIESQFSSRFMYLNNNQLSGIVPILSTVDFLRIHNNYFSCEDIEPNFNENNQIRHFIHSPQYYQSANDTIKQSYTSYIIDSIGSIQNLVLKDDFPWDETNDLNYQWMQNGDTINGATQSTLTINDVLPQSAGRYTLHIKNDNCLPNGNSFEFVSDPFYVIVKGYDLYGQPVEYDQIMVEFASKDETYEFEEEILAANGGEVIKACNCNRELYLWEFPTSEAAARALLEIDQKHKRLKTVNEPTGGFNNIISIADSTDASIAYNIISNKFNLEYPDSVCVFILDSGLDTTNYNATSYLYQYAQIDSCYTIEKSGGYNYTDSAELVNENYLDDLWHGTFGFRSIADSLTENSKLKIVPLKIFNKEGKGNLFDMACALYHAIDHNADIVNISAGYKGQPSTVLERAILLAREKGIFITAATGNDTLNIDSIPQYPAYYSGQYYIFEDVDELGNIVKDTIKYDNVISVASINVENELSGFSNYGQQSVTLACYGENIHSYALQGLDAVASGSSMATYFATKALALEISKNNTRDYEQIWTDFENDWLISNSELTSVTQTGKQINFDIEEAIIFGCTNQEAENYFSFATEDDGTCIITSIESSVNDLGFTVFPNPSNGDVYLNFNQNKGDLKKIEVFNSIGQIVLAKKSLEQIVHLNMQEFLKGVYFLKVTNDGNTLIKKVVLK